MIFTYLCEHILEGGDAIHASGPGLYMWKKTDPREYNLACSKNARLQIRLQGPHKAQLFHFLCCYVKYTGQWRLQEKQGKLKSLEGNSIRHTF